MTVTFLRARHLIFSTLLYASLIFSSALQFTVGPEAVIRVGGYYLDGRESRNADFQRMYPDFGSLGDDSAARDALKLGADWKFTSFWADAAYYRAQVLDLNSSIPPYRYRLFPTMIVQAIVLLTTLEPESAFILFNVAACLATALLFELFLLNFFRLQRMTALLGGCLFVTSASNTGTLGFPMLEPAAALFSCLIFFTAAYGRAGGFIVTSILGVLTKEVLAISSLIWLLTRPNPGRDVLKNLFIASVPSLAFVATRILLGGSALEVNYGYDLLRGDLPNYGKRLLQFRTAAGVAVQVFLSFSFLWFGLIAAYRHRFLRRCLVIVPITVVAAILLSSRLTRVLGVLFPIVIPGCLLWLQGMLCAPTQLEPASPDSVPRAAPAG